MSQRILLDLLQHVLADVVRFERLVELGHEANCLVEQLHRRTKQIAKDSRHRHHDVDARPAEFSQRNRFDARGPIQSIANRARAEQPERLGHAFALRLDVVESPEHERHRFRVAAVLVFVTIEQTVRDRLRCAQTQRRKARRKD